MVLSNIFRKKRFCYTALYYYLSSKAKLLLKKKHYQENLLKKTDDQLEAIDKLVSLNQLIMAATTSMIY